MNPRSRAVLQLAVLLGVTVLLLLLFPAGLAFVEMAARELRYLWWLILLAALGAWLVWGVGRKKK
ncbi:hypothetical protein [Horticoccus sp. 23ND18S-11]|uniref:hypothetical protein n=1 Tax=Horticoccus sp. 23ND18S-11 TaxID=3391832 RepID=UPI0039C9B907